MTDSKDPNCWRNSVAFIKADNAVVVYCMSRVEQNKLHYLVFAHKRTAKITKMSL